MLPRPALMPRTREFRFAKDWFESAREAGIGDGYFFDFATIAFTSSSVMRSQLSLFG